MRKTFAGVLMMALAVAAIPAKLFAAVKTGARQQSGQSGSVSGNAQDANKAALPNYGVRLRNLSTGLIVANSTSTEVGSFSFANVLPGNYVVEILDASGKVVGLSSSVAVGAGAVSVTVTATAAGVIGGAAATGGGFGLLGLGTAASVAVISAAGAATALVAIQASGDAPTASPSK